MSQIKFDAVELTKINLKPGDVLSVKLIGEDFDFDTMQSLRDSLQQVFKDNKIMVFTMPPGSDIVFEAVTNEPSVGYCSDCDCGKKERNESSG